MTCTIVNTFKNQEISVLFSVPIDQSSINSSSFRVVDVDNGTTPLGEFFVDDLNPRRLIFRPQLSFGLDGVPIFGFEDLKTYEITIPGTAQGDAGPFIRSRAGRLNQGRLQCTIFTDQGVIDPVPGRPRMTAFVETVNDTDTTTNVSTGEVTLGQTRVKSLSEIRMVFDDIMNVATLLDPLTGNSNFVTVEIDEDGQLASDTDRDPVAGSYDVEVDLEALQTILTFKHQVRVANEAAPQPTAGFPSAGSNSLSPRRIVLTIDTTVVDLVNQSLSDDPLVMSFVPESANFEPLILPGMVADAGAPFDEGNGAEDFEFSNSDFSPPNPDDPDEVSREDARRSGAIWGDGRLVRSIGGGSGRLGDLVIEGGETVTLNTDSQTFPLFGDRADIIGNEVYDAMDQPTGDYLQSITITDGTFEFNTVEIQTGGTLIFEGSNPARLFSKGRMIIANGARIDVSGSTPVAHDSAHSDPEIDWDGTGSPEFYAGVDFTAIEPAGGGPAAGSGGLGGTRFNREGLTALTTGRGFLLSTAFRPGWDGLTDMNGQPGAGIGGADPDTEPGNGSGTGGSRWPQALPTSLSAGTTGSTPAGTADLNWNDILNNTIGGLACFCRQVGGVGAGGAFGTGGSGGSSTSDQALADWFVSSGVESNLPDPPTAGSEIPDRVANDPNTGTLNYLSEGYGFRKLAYNPALPPGNLIGGSGGGGGGQHPYGTYANGLQNDLVQGCSNPGSLLDNWNNGANPGWLDHSGAAGGGGGGAIQLVSGVRITVDGVVDASGGNGGSPVTFSQVPFGGLNAMPGGGGSGGAVLMQSRQVDLADQAGRIDVSGGLGGVASSLWGASTGGEGGAGLVRIETELGGPPDADGADHAAIDQRISPYDAVNGDTVNGEYGKFSLDFLSIEKGGWRVDTRYQPASYSASTSCWVQPPGNYFKLDFATDSQTSTDPEDQGWNMEVIYEFNGQEVRLPFRGDNDLFQPLEDIWGNCLNHGNETGVDGNCNGGTETTRSPIIVRFQGARIATSGADLCDVGVALPIDPSSVTPWVKHPSELNPNSALGRNWPQPNLIRFTVIFDYAVNLGGISPDAIIGVDNLWIRSNPD